MPEVPHDLNREQQKGVANDPVAMNRGGAVGWAGYSRRIDRARHIWRLLRDFTAVVGTLTVLWFAAGAIGGGLLVSWASLSSRFGTLGTVVLILGLAFLAVGVVGLLAHVRPWHRKSPPKVDLDAALPRQRAYLAALLHEREGYVRRGLRDRVRQVDDQIKLARDDWWEDEFPHRPGCPSRPERLETYSQLRPDGIEVYITRCVDCGAAKYEHIDAPTKPPTHDVPSMALQPQPPAVQPIRPLTGAERISLRTLIGDGEALHAEEDVNLRAAEQWTVRVESWLERHSQPYYLRRFREIDPVAHEARDGLERKLVDLRTLLVANVPAGFALDLTPSEALDRWMEVQGTPEADRPRLRELTERFMREAEEPRSD
jgi:Arc/MetJ family transcription regulator